MFFHYKHTTRDYNSSIPISVSKDTWIRGSHVHSLWTRGEIGPHMVLFTNKPPSHQFCCQHNITPSNNFCLDCGFDYITIVMLLWCHHLHVDVTFKRIFQSAQNRTRSRQERNLKLICAFYCICFLFVSWSSFNYTVIFKCYIML